MKIIDKKRYNERQREVIRNGEREGEERDEK